MSDNNNNNDNNNKNNSNNILYSTTQNKMISCIISYNDELIRHNMV